MPQQILDNYEATLTANANSSQGTLAVSSIPLLAITATVYAVVDNEQFTFNGTTGTLGGPGTLTGLIRGISTTAASHTAGAIVQATVLTNASLNNLGGAGTSLDAVLATGNTSTRQMSTGAITAPSFNGSGAALSALNASAISTGTLSVARLPNLNSVYIPIQFDYGSGTAGNVTYEPFFQNGAGISTAAVYQLTTAGGTNANPLILTTDGTLQPVLIGTTSPTATGYVIEMARPTQFNAGLTIAGGDGSIHGDGFGGITFVDGSSNSLNWNVAVNSGLSLNDNSLTGVGQCITNGGATFTDDGSGGAVLADTSGNQLIWNTLNSGLTLSGYEILEVTHITTQLGGGLPGTVASAIYESNADALSTTSTSIQTLLTRSIGSGLLQTNKDKIQGQATFTLASTGGTTKTIGVSLGGTSIFSSGALTIAAMTTLVLSIHAIRVSATAVRCTVAPLGLSTLLPVVTDVTGLSLTGTCNLLFTATVATGAISGDVTLKMDSINYVPYSGN